jgi:hypothetical protein
MLALVVVLGLGPAGPAPLIGSPRPTIIQSGTTSEVVVTGQHLASTTRAVFSPDGAISCEVASRKAGEVRLRVTASADAELGERELRLVTAAGVSNGVALNVGAFPVTVATGGTGPGGVPQPLVLPAVVDGLISRQGQTDRLRFTAAATHTVVFEVDAVRSGSMLEPAVTLEDHRGRVVAWERSRVDGDVQVIFKPRTAGDYDLVIRDLRFRGGKGFYYRIRCSADSGGADAPAEGGVHETEPNDVADKASEVSVPCVVSGRIDQAGDADVFRFKVDRKQTLVIDVAARTPGSPVDALLLIDDANGKRIVANDDGNGRDARIRRAFGPGIYTATVKDLVGAGGREYDYQFSIAPPTAPTPSFALRFLPDTPRVGRESHRKLWCQATRSGGFKGEVVVTFSELPVGVAASPVTLGPVNGWTSVFTLSASADAPLGSAPITVTATGQIGEQKVSVPCVPERGGVAQQQAYVTVLDHPPVTVRPLEPPSAAERQGYADQLVALRAELAAPSEKVAAERASWEKGVRDAKASWVVLEPTSMTAAKGSKLQLLRDASILTSGVGVQTDAFTLVAATHLANLAALRIEMIPDDVLPKRGPGRQPGSGNFVLSELKVTASPAGRPGEAAPVKLQNAAARFSQNGYAVAAAIDGNPSTGWAMHPQEGRENWAVFDLASPVGGAGGTRLELTIEQNHGGEHLLGRFRVSVAQARLAGEGPAFSERIVQLVRTDPRTEEADKELDTWFREHQSEHLATIRTRIEELESGYGGGIAIDRLNKILDTQTPELAAAQKKWEAEQTKKLTRWTPVPFTSLKSEQGVRFDKEPDHVARVRAAAGDTDTYTVEVHSDVRPITGIRLEALADKKLPAGGPGFGVNGNFVLSRIRVLAWPASDASAVQPVPLHRPQASFEQGGWPVINTLDTGDNTGWAIAGQIGQDNMATWQLKQPVDHDGGAALRLILDHKSVHARHIIGRFRVSVTSSPNPGLGDGSLPTDVADIIPIPESERSPTQKDRLSAFYRSIASELEPVRKHLAVVRAQQAPYPPTVARGKKTRIAVRIAREDGFNGPVTLTLEGFSSGRDGKGNPKLIAANIKATPKILAPGEEVAVIDLEPTNKSELGTRFVVIRAEAKVGKETSVEYSAPIPLTVSK